jgi:predicted helicase
MMGAPNKANRYHIIYRKDISFLLDFYLVHGPKKSKEINNPLNNFITPKLSGVSHFYNSFLQSRYNLPIPHIKMG